MPRTTKHDNRLTEYRPSSQYNAGIISGNRSNMRHQMEGSSAGFDSWSHEVESKLSALRLEPSRHHQGVHRDELINNYPEQSAGASVGGLRGKKVVSYVRTTKRVVIYESSSSKQPKRQEIQEIEEEAYAEDGEEGDYSEYEEDGDYSEEDDQQDDEDDDEEQDEEDDEEQNEEEGEEGDNDVEDARSWSSKSVEGYGGDMEPVDIDISMEQADLQGGGSDDDDDEDEIISFAWKGQHKDVSWILKRDPDRILAKNKAEDTALHVASRGGHVDTVKVLLRHGAQVSIANKKGDMPLHLALREEHLQVALELLRMQPRVGYQLDSEGVAPLFEAVKQGHDNFVSKLFSLLPGHEVSDSTIEALVLAQPPILHEAIKARNLGTLSLLLENIPGLVYSKDECGCKPLSYAASQGFSKEVSYMIEKFSQCLNRPDDDGYYPIHNAVRYGCIRVLQRILSSCPEAIMHQTKKKKETIVHVAHRYSQPKVIDYLKNEKAKLLKKTSGLADRNGKSVQYILEKY